jgi:hypothetical protein
LAKKYEPVFAKKARGSYSGSTSWMAGTSPAKTVRAKRAKTKKTGAFGD